MTSLLYLAWRHMTYRRLTSLTLVLVLTTLVTIPMLAGSLTRAAETRMMARAEATPLVFGAAGAPLDLVLSAAYFRSPLETNISMQDYDWLFDTGLAALAPIHHAGRARGLPIVGTEFDYFFLRDLDLIAGRFPVRTGEVLLGAKAADALRVGVGDVVVSDVEQAFNLAGAYPVGMIVSGVIAPTGTADDEVILTDLKTGWIVHGLGHGHDDLAAQADTTVILDTAEDGTVTANASLPTLEMISADRLADFHFHGAPETFPLSAVLVFPNDRKSAALLQGRVADLESPVQILRAENEVRGLMNNVLRVTEILTRVLLAISVAALLAIGLVIWLSVQMRTREFEISKRLGAPRILPAMLVGTEIALIAAAALLLSFCILLVVRGLGEGSPLVWMLGG